MEIFRGLRDVEKHLLKFLPTRDVIRLKRICKTWQNMLNSIEHERFKRLPIEYWSIWGYMITEKYCKNCIFFLLNLSYVWQISSYDNVKVYAFDDFITHRVLHIKETPEQILMTFSTKPYSRLNCSEFKEIDQFPEIKQKSRWIQLFPEDK